MIPVYVLTGLMAILAPFLKGIVIERIRNVERPLWFRVHNKPLPKQVRL